MPSITTPINLSIIGISVSRLGAGALAILSPRFGGALFGIPFDPQTAIFTRLFGARDLVLALLCFQARSNLIQDKEKDINLQAKRDMKMLLWAGLIVDTIDVSSAMVGLWKGEMGTEAVAWVGGGAFSFVLLAVFTLRGL